MSEQATEATTDAEQGAEEATDDAPTGHESDAQEADDNGAEDWRKNFDADRAADRIRKLQSEAKNLRERAKQAETKAGDVDSLTKSNGELTAENLRLKVGYELGLPLALAERLRGSTREELLSDADALVKIAGGSAKPPATRKPVEALRGGAAVEREPEETDTRKIAERMFRN